MKNKESEVKRFYEFSQTNSGGSFTTNDKLCHRLFIEAADEREANFIAEGLGVYFNGVQDGRDCNCCGDRWREGDLVNYEEQNTRWGGYEVQVWADSLEGKKTDSELIKYFENLYSGYTWIVPPIVEKKYGSKRVCGKVKIENIEQYAQVMANQYGWTFPDARIFYKDKSVKEIFSIKPEKKSTKRLK